MALKVMSSKRPGELTSAKEVVEKTGCPFDATARVLQQMAQAGILQSEQGAHGGYALLRDLGKFAIFDLMEVIQGSLAVARCLEGEGACDLKHTCNILSPVTVLNRKLGEFYQSLSVGELLRVEERTAEPVEVSL